MTGKLLYEVGWRIYTPGGDYVWVKHPNGDEFTIWLPEYFHKGDASYIARVIGCDKEAVLDLDDICEASGYVPPPKTGRVTEG